MLHLYIYGELEGKKGKNNLFSCLMNNFKDMGYFSSPNFGELTIYYDNCERKNKRNITTLYILWLLNTGLFNVQHCCF